MKKRALFGSGGHAREVMAQMQEHMIMFVDDSFYNKEPQTLPLSCFDPAEYKLMIAIGDSRARERVSKILPSDTEYFSFIHPSALLMDASIEVGAGSFIGAYSVLTTNIKIGNHALLNRSNHIGHDCYVGNFFSSMPGSILSGNCRVGNCVYLGTNSSVKEKIIICSNVTVGLNAGVVKNIDEPGIYLGVPAKLKERHV